MRANVSRFHTRQNAIAFRNTAALREPGYVAATIQRGKIHWTTEIELANQ
jgi:hypothetical protein